MLELREYLIIVLLLIILIMHESLNGCRLGIVEILSILVHGLRIVLNLF